MTGIVDDRQRLVERARASMEREEWGTPEDVAFVRSVLEALASPSEGNKKGDEPKEWRCFHCDEVFTDTNEAREHFGDEQSSLVACAIDIPEYRRMEEVHRQHLSESDEVSRDFYRIEADHRRALIREEEKGYERGLADANASRPQEQPRKATEEMDAWDLPEPLTLAKVVEWKAEAEELLFKTMEGPYSVIVTLCDHILSVSPAAAQGWQSVPIVPTEAMLHAATMIAPTWDDAASRAKYAAMLAAAPPAPAAQEQEP